MTSQDALFGDGSESAAPTARPHVSGIADWQVNALRTALDQRGMASMAERQRIIESIVGRDVASLRELTSAEAQRVLEGLTTDRQDRATSSWDDREEDTWIDRL